MTFWGIEIQPEKSFLHTDEDGMTKLHLSQATLGLNCKGKQRTVVKCKVGENPEVLLCSLVPGVQESCALDLLFDQEVTFTVSGATSVHLTGYYMPLDPYDSEDESDYDSEEEGFEFSGEDEDISDLEGHPSSVKIVEVNGDEDAKKNALAITNGEKKGKKRKKVDSAVKPAKGEDTVMGEDDTEDEDGFALPGTKGAAEQTPAKKHAVAGADGVPTPGAATLTAVPAPGAATLTAVPAPGAATLTAVPAPGAATLTAVLTPGAATLTAVPAPGVATLTAVPTPGVATLTAVPTPGAATPTAVPTPGAATPTAVPTPGAATPTAVPTPGAATPTAVPTPGAATPTADTPTSQGKKNKRNRKKNKNQHATETPEAKVNGEAGKVITPANTPAAEDASTPAATTPAAKEEEKETTPKKGTPTAKKFPNGLEVETLAIGKPDGKKAAAGKKVAMQYIGKLKSNGKVFDSTVGKKPFEFRLGVGEVIKGWDVGVDGMRIGDKRRLTIPPQMAYGTKGVPGTIPGNSWLTFDVELVNVK